MQLDWINLGYSNIYNCRKNRFKNLSIWIVILAQVERMDLRNVGHGMICEYFFLSKGHLLHHSTFGSFETYDFSPHSQNGDHQQQ